MKNGFFGVVACVAFSSAAAVLGQAGGATPLTKATMQHCLPVIGIPPCGKFDEAIRVGPTNAAAYVGRASAHAGQG